MRDREMTVVPKLPSDRDEVVRHIEPTLRTERDVMQSGLLNVLAADPATLPVSFEYEVPNVTGDESQSFEFDLRSGNTVHGTHTTRRT